MKLDLIDSETTVDLLQFDEKFRQMGFERIAGIDEAGRGALAGPIVAAAVVFGRGCSIQGVDDSKKLTAGLREKLYERILEEALAVGVGVGDSALVDNVNVLQATLHAMKQAVLALPSEPDFLLVDGISSVPMNCRQRAIAKGDSLSMSIAAASIVAKVTRDRMMLELDAQYPEFGFARHKGYGSNAHLTAIEINGPSPIHRLTFRGVREFAGVGIGR